MRAPARRPVPALENLVKLYDSGPAPNPRRVRIFLAEKGVEVDLVPVDIAGAENRKPPYLAKNPLGGIPMLELDDGAILTESVAICRYFEGLHPDPPLMGVDARDRAFVEMWNRRMEIEITSPLGQAFRHTHAMFAERIEQVPDWGEACGRQAAARLAWLDAELADREFIAGDRFSMADITALVGIDFGALTGHPLDPEHENLARWHAAVSARPSATA